MSKELKGLILKELKSSFDELEECVIVTLNGIKVESSNQLRSDLRDNGARMKVVKNSLARLALKELEREELSPLIDGPTAMVYGGEGIVPLAKKLQNWTKTNEDIVIRGGFLSGDVLSPQDVGKLSTVPSREVLLSQVLSGITSPASNFVNILTAKFREFAQCINALKEKVAEGGE